ncbi:hypothetical protein WDZ92_32600, partial [Nostoc sp. NIES-2111]
MKHLAPLHSINAIGTACAAPRTYDLLHGRRSSSALNLLATAVTALLVSACGGGGDAVADPPTIHASTAMAKATSAGTSAPASLPLAGVLAATNGESTATTTRSTFTVLPLAQDLYIPPINPEHPEETVVQGVELHLRAGESRRVSNRLALDLTTTRAAEVDNRITCRSVDSAGLDWTSSSGTNHLGSDAGTVVLSNTLLIKANNPGLYRCDVLSYTARQGLDYSEIARALQSSIQFSTADEAGAQQWDHVYFCSSRGEDLKGVNSCEYLHPGSSKTILPAPHDPGDSRRWTAADNATEVDVKGTFQLTSCPYGTASCQPGHWGPSSIFGSWSTEDNAVVDTFVMFNQLYPDGTVCRIHFSTDPYALSQTYNILTAIHHLPVHYQLVAPVSPNCKGSRTFELQV